MPIRTPGFIAPDFEGMLVTDWGSDAHCLHVNEDEDVADALDLLREHIAWLATDERTSGPSSALRDYGRVFNPAKTDPGWLIKGAVKSCYENSTAYAVVRTDIYYAEGYAIDPSLPIPIEHAWLVNHAGEVIDPTWDRVGDRVYFGIAFNRVSVMETLEASGGEAGILVNWHVLRNRRGAIPQPSLG